MERWRYSVQRGDNWASTRTFFDSIEDALAFIYGQERFNPHYSAEFIIRKIKFEEAKEEIK